MNIIKIYYKGEANEIVDDILKDAMGRKGYLLSRVGYNFKEKARDLEFDFEPLPEAIRVN